MRIGHLRVEVLEVVIHLDPVSAFRSQRIRQRSDLRIRWIEREGALIVGERERRPVRGLVQLSLRDEDRGTVSREGLRTAQRVAGLSEPAKRRE